MGAREIGQVDLPGRLAAGGGPSGAGKSGNLDPLVREAASRAAQRAAAARSAAREAAEETARREVDARKAADEAAQRAAAAREAAEYGEAARKAADEAAQREIVAREALQKAFGTQDADRHYRLKDRVRREAAASMAAFEAAEEAAQRGVDARKAADEAAQRAAAAREAARDAAKRAVVARAAAEEAEEEAGALLAAARKALDETQDAGAQLSSRLRAQARREGTVSDASPTLPGRSVQITAAFAQIGALITTYAHARGLSSKMLAERIGMRYPLFEEMMAGGEVRAPWALYERLFLILKIPVEDQARVRELWDLSHKSRGPSAGRPPTYKDSLHRLRADVAGHDLEPDPLRASTKEEFLAVMREFQVWAGDLSYREISLNARKSVGVSTLCEALATNKPPRLPTLKLVQAFIEGCGGDEDTVARWTTAWRQVRMGRCATTVSPLRPVQQQDAS